MTSPAWSGVPVVLADAQTVPVPLQVLVGDASGLAPEGQGASLDLV